MYTNMRFPILHQPFLLKNLLFIKPNNILYFFKQRVKF